jgi:hypothetical protein
MVGIGACALVTPYIGGLHSRGNAPLHLGKWPEIEPFAAALVVRGADDGFELLPLSPAATAL